jgi:hypothetical protein
MQDLISMEIQVGPHPLERAEERGSNEEEIKDVINTGFPIPVKYGRVGRAKIYGFNQKRRGKHYEQKRVGANRRLACASGRLGVSLSNA